MFSQLHADRIIYICAYYLAQDDFGNNLHTIFVFFRNRTPKTGQRFAARYGLHPRYITMKTPLTFIAERPVVAASAGDVEDGREEKQQRDSQQDRYDDQAVLADAAQEAAAAALVRRSLRVAVAVACVAAVAGLGVAAGTVASGAVASGAVASAAVTSGIVAGGAEAASRSVPVVLLGVLGAVEGSVTFDDRRRGAQLAVTDTAAGM